MMAILVMVVLLEFVFKKAVVRKGIRQTWNPMEAWKLGLVNCVEFPGNREQVL